METAQSGMVNLEAEIDHALTELTRNLVAVARGGGCPSEIANQVRNAAYLLGDYENREADDPDPHRLAAALRRFGPELAE